MSRYIGNDGFYKYYSRHGPNSYKHGQCFEDYILESIGREEIGFKEIYIRVLDSYGYVPTRTLHRRLNKLIRLKLISRLNNTFNVNNPNIKYRLLKTAIRKL